ncbi:methanethiol oxidase isoform X2 [Anolis carolinensis]|uniref:methanethiol oxidase isoform X2 n=1 Tax=Anolis carolinensis TaxID=28377 RepID=UPI002F2B3947
MSKIQNKAVDVKHPALKNPNKGRYASCHGPGYASPLEAMKGPKEKLMYVVCVLTQTDTRQPDYLATVDVDPESPCYCQVIHRLHMPYLDDELHHSGWNAPVSTFGDTGIERNCLVLPGLRSGRVYVVDTGSDLCAPSLCKVIEPREIIKKTDLGNLSSSHCLCNGDVLISALGDAFGNGKGGILALDSETWEVKGNWESKEDVPAGMFDFWYQPQYNVLITSDLGEPKFSLNQFSIDNLRKGRYGRYLHVWDLSTHHLLQTIDMGEDATPLEIRFLHNPNSCHGYVTCPLEGSINHFFKTEDGCWRVEKVIQIPNKKVSGWRYPEVPAFPFAIVISLNDKFLYLSNWLHGDVRQYDITDPHCPKLVGQVFVGGCLEKGGPVTVLEDPELDCQPDPFVIQGRKVQGGPQKLQLSLDGHRLYVTNSLYTPWDKEFYPKLVREGSVMLQLHANTEKGGLCVNPEFLVDFGHEPSGPARAKEMRYPGGDCTSDIWE